MCVYIVDFSLLFNCPVLGEEKSMNYRLNSAVSYKEEQDGRHPGYM